MTKSQIATTAGLNLKKKPPTSSTYKVQIHFKTCKKEGLNKMGNCNSDGAAKGQNFLIEEIHDAHTAGINCTALSEDGSILATGSEDKTARLWSTKTPQCECIGILKGHEDYINAVLIEDTFVLTGSADKTIRKWDMNTCDCVFVFRGHNSLINRIICTGDFVFSSSYDRTARCWDFDTGKI